MKLFATERRHFLRTESIFGDGIVDVSDDLRIERLLEAYSFGIFPWPHEDLPTLWFCPEERGVLDFARVHVPRSLQKFLRHCAWTVTFNRCFDDVLAACAEAPRPGQDGTWITPKMARAYIDFHRAGYAHSVEVWDGEELIGGMYGVYVAGVFSGESMFYRRTNASKFALLKLVEFLRAQSLEWMDIQMVTPLLELFGGRYVSRAAYLERLERAKVVAKPLSFPMTSPS